MQILCEENITEKLFSLYNQLLAQHGDSKWWPADTPFEVALGAILTQATSWRNVEKAMDNLKNAGAFTAEEIASISQVTLERLIRPSPLLSYEGAKGARLCGLYHGASHARDVRARCPRTT